MRGAETAAGTGFALVTADFCKLLDFHGGRDRD